MIVTEVVPEVVEVVTPSSTAVVVIEVQVDVIFHGGVTKVFVAVPFGPAASCSSGPDAGAVGRGFLEAPSVLRRGAPGPSSFLGLGRLQILEGGLLYGEGGPVVPPGDGGGRLEETSTLAGVRVHLVHQFLHTPTVSLDRHLNPLGVFLQTVQLRRDVRQGHVSALLQDLDPFGSVPQKQRVVVPSHNVAPHVGDLEHLAQFLGIARDEIQKAESIEILGPLIAHLHHLMIPLP
mmetsp:Transcript_53925/g.161381  ORF Transcript_53925/g.161381 Transcript_53925/m.161381 type:complete len:234 (+) Transcript_53925:1133-1834(+)